MITNPTFLQRLFKCSIGRQHDRHGTFDYSQPLHQVALRLWSAWDWLLDRPRVLRFDLANLLAFCAEKLRRSPTREIGYGVIGNEAAALRDILATDIIMHVREDEQDEMLDRLDRLSEIAHSNWWDPKCLPKCCQPEEQLTATD